MEQPDYAANAERQAALAQVGHVALSSATLVFIFTHSAQIVRKVLGMEFCSIYKAGARKLLLVGGAGWPDGIVGSAEVECGPNSLAGYTIEQREPVVVEDVRLEKRFIPARFLVEKGAVSALAVAIDAGEDEPWGVLAAYSRTPRQFTTNDVEFLRAMATTLGQAIERRRVEVELRVRAVQQSAIAELGQRVLTRDVDQTVLERVCELVMDSLGVEFSLFLEADDSGASLAFRAGHRWRPDSTAAIASQESHAGAALRSEQLIVVEDYESDHRFNSSFYVPFAIRCGLAVPVTAPSGKFGVLTANTRSMKRFTPADVHFMQSLAAVLAHGLARERANRELVESEQRFRSVVEGASEIIFSLSPRGEITSLNPAFEAITGWRCDEWLNRSFEELVVPEQLPDMQALFVSMFAEPRTIRTEARMRAKNGSEILVAATVSPKIVRGIVAELYGFARDVTDERRLQIERNRAARELQLVLESTDEGIFATDVNGRCTIVNRLCSAS